jgi:hypothetical protein
MLQENYDLMGDVDTGVSIFLSFEAKTYFGRKVNDEKINSSICVCGSGRLVGGPGRAGSSDG